MEHLGSFSLILALALAIFGTISAFLAAIYARERFRLVAVRSYVGVAVLVLIAVVSLGYLLMNDKFSLVYIYNHSNVALPWYYKITAVWAGSQGSLMWWTLITVAYTCIFLFFTRKAPKLMMSWALVFVGMSLIFFLLINNLVAPPFNFWGQSVGGVDPVAFVPRDGRGLNPQLQHWGMIIHPPMLYTGYIGFLYPFALAMGALITRMEGREWIRLIRNWTLAAWGILGAGIVLGGAWAYMELGWGGYWAWDPVENASFMPWLLATGFVHSVMAQEKRGMFKLWNVLLITSTFLMCLVGTGITRSGMISSVHAFAESDIGWYFLGYIIANSLLAGWIIFARRDQLRDDNRYQSETSREVGLLFNNVLFVVICITMFLATIYPMITEAYGDKRELRHGFYNTVEIPIFLALMALMAVGPILTWKRTSPKLIRERFLIPSIIGLLVTIGALFLFGVIRTSPLAFMSEMLYPAISVGVLTFLGITIFQEFWVVVGRRSKRAGEFWPTAFISVVRMNKRRYGGFLAHFGILLVAIGLTGAAFNKQDKKDLGIGEVMEVGGYTFMVQDMGFNRTDNFSAMHAEVTLLKDGKKLKTFHPEQRVYLASEMTASEVAISETIMRDFYVVLAGSATESTKEHLIGTFHIYVNPLVVWVWIGSFITTFAIGLCMLPDKVPVRATSSVTAGNEEPA